MHSAKFQGIPNRHNLIEDNEVVRAQQRIRPPPTMPHVDMINYHNAHFIVAE